MLVAGGKHRAGDFFAAVLTQVTKCSFPSLATRETGITALWIIFYKVTRLVGVAFYNLGFVIALQIRFVFRLLEINYAARKTPIW